MERARDIPSLDGLRFSAAFIVFVSHFSNLTGVFGFHLGKGAGQIGLMLFFLLSAFLIGWLYLPFTFTVKRAIDFSRRRAARVLPLYFLIVLLTWLAFKTYGAASPVSTVQDENLMEHLLLIRGGGVFWTVPVEMHFYLLFILIWWIYSRWPDTVILILSAIILFNAYLGGNKLIPNFELSIYMHFFMAGLLCAIFALRFPNYMNHILANKIFMLTFLSIPLLYPMISFALTGIVSPLWNAEFIMILLALLLLSSIKSNIAHLLLGNKVTRYLGNISYSMYLCHAPILVMFGRVEFIKEFNFLYFLMSFFATIFCSSVLFFCFERPFRRWLSGAPLTPVRPTR